MDSNFTDKREDRDLDRLIIDDQLDKLYQAFNDYKKGRSMDDIDPKDFMDKYFAQNTTNINASNCDFHYDAKSIIKQISKDFEMFERTELLSTTKTPIEFNNNVDQLGGNVHEFDRMIQEMNSGTWQCTSSNAHPSHDPFGYYSNNNVTSYEDDGRGGQQLISGNDAQSTIMQISKDFEAFERTKLHPPTEALVDFNNNIDQLGEDVDETERMIEEMASQYTSSNAHQSYNPFGCYSDAANVVSYAGHGGGGGLLVNDIANDSSGPVIRYFFCGQTKNVAKANHRRKRQKRKYRGVVMSDEVRLLKLAKQKIKNREVAARTHERRVAREAHLESLHVELLMENTFLKKVNKFLEDHRRVNVLPEPLRRSISGPMLIQ